MYKYIDFEKKVEEIEGKIIEMKKIEKEKGRVEMGEEIRRIEKR